MTVPSNGFGLTVQPRPTALWYARRTAGTYPALKAVLMRAGFEMGGASYPRNTRLRELPLPHFKTPTTPTPSTRLGPKARKAVAILALVRVSSKPSSGWRWDRAKNGQLLMIVHRRVILCRIDALRIFVEIAPMHVLH